MRAVGAAAATLAGLLLAVACGDATEPDAAIDAGRASDASERPTADGAASVVDGAGDASTFDLYDPSQVREFQLSIDADAYAILSSTSTDEDDKKKWAKGTFTFGNEVLHDVGIRRKGSSSFRALPGKAAFKIRFDKNVSGQRFHGLAEITLNSMVSDGTFLAERLGYHVFRAAGLPAQRANTAHLVIASPGGTDDYGIYANVETPNEDLLERLFGAKKKTLYEANGGGTWAVGDEGAFDVQVGADTADLLLLLQSASAASSATLLADVDAHLDTTEWLKFSALEGIVGQIDGYGYGKFGSHNYFLAGDTAARFVALPWSLDIGMSDNNGVLDMSNPRPADPEGGDTFLVRCKAAASCWATYKTTVSAMLTVYEGLDLVSLAKTWHAQIDTLARSDPKKEVTVEGYDGETAKLYEWLAARPGIVRAQLGL